MRNALRCFFFSFSVRSSFPSSPHFQEKEDDRGGEERREIFVRTSSIVRARDSNIRPRASREQTEREDAAVAAVAAAHQSQSSASSRNPIPLEKWGKIFPKKENAMMKCAGELAQGRNEGRNEGRV